jgi:hypothetical protein
MEREKYNMEGKSDSKIKQGGAATDGTEGNMCVDVIAGEWHGAGWGKYCPTSGIWRVGEVQVVAHRVVGGKFTTGSVSPAG